MPPKIKYQERYDPEIFIDSTRDKTKHRIWITKFNKVHFRQEGPHGFWYVHLDKGQLKKQLKGAFSTFADAERAVKTYYLMPMNEEIRDRIG